MIDYTELSTREAYGKIITEMGAVDTRIVVLDADLSRSVMTKYFVQAHPGRFFQCGLAEQNMISIAAGLASCGKIPLASTFAVFASCRCFDQVRMCVAQPKANVKIVSTHGGITVGEDGSSHQAIEDLALYCSLPNFNVIAPSDSIETVEAIKAAIATDGPFYVRLGRSKTPVIYANGCKFKLGQADMLLDGRDASIIATGIMVSKSIEAANLLKLDGVHCRVLNMSTLKPIDRQSIITAAVDTGAVVTAEEHLLHGGLGSIVAQVLSANIPVPLVSIGIDDTYCQSGKPDELLEMNGLTAPAIVAAVRDVVTKKNKRYT
jgi:transketolase